MFRSKLPASCSAGRIKSVEAARGERAQIGVYGQTVICAASGKSEAAQDESRTFVLGATFEAMCSTAANRNIRNENVCQPNRMFPSRTPNTALLKLAEQRTYVVRQRDSTERSRRRDNATLLRIRLHGDRAGWHLAVTRARTPSDSPQF